MRNQYISSDSNFKNLFKFSYKGKIHPKSAKRKLKDLKTESLVKLIIDKHKYNVYSAAVR